MVLLQASDADAVADDNDDHAGQYVVDGCTLR